jgi:hypothetical protein
VTIEANTANCLSSAGLWISQRAPLKITPSMPALTPSFSRLARYWSSSGAPSSGSSAFQPSSGGTIEARSRDHPKVVVLNFVQPHRPARAVNARRAAARIHSPPKMPAGTGAVAFRSVFAFVVLQTCNKPHSAIRHFTHVRMKIDDLLFIAAHRTPRDGSVLSSPSRTDMVVGVIGVLPLVTHPNTVASAMHVAEATSFQQRRARDCCQRRLAATVMPILRAVSCVTTGPPGLSRIRRRRSLTRFKRHHSSKSKIWESCSAVSGALSAGRSLCGSLPPGRSRRRQVSSLPGRSRKRLRPRGAVGERDFAGMS